MVATAPWQMWRLTQLRRYRRDVGWAKLAIAIGIDARLDDSAKRLKLALEDV